MPGKTRFARTLLRASGPALLQDRFGHSVVVPSLRDPIGYHLFADGVYEPAVVELLQVVLRPGDTFIDVGANVGVHSLIASDRVGTSGRVMAIEPAAPARTFLSANLELNQAANVSVEPYALSDRTQSAGLYIPQDQHLGMATLIPRFHHQPVEVSTTTLDQLMKRFDLPVAHLLKVDVEGAEALVFRGGIDTLTSQHPPLVVFEFADWAETGWDDVEPGSAQRVLRSCGYEIWELSAYLASAAPLTKIVRSGTCMLVGRSKVMHQGGGSGLVA